MASRASRTRAGPLTDDHAADVIAASQLMLSASFELADAEEERTRRKAFGARCERIAVAAFIALAAVFLTVAIVGITLDATH
ncbi:hypothetical protein [Actinomadura madurae]|uniref:hypothetical protein n=1 Tax=Actinomadura madurae TaxID=1993 RepID=UPI0020D23F13|nr:hypothetical protein [Actinomadura madurae]MCQ0012646.1 hypothetical protein [Actinomadura madurae]